MSTAQSAHYIVRSDGTWYPADMRNSHNAGSRERWRVRYSPCPTLCGMTYWAVYAPGGWLPVKRFVTHAEALAYANRMARVTAKLLLTLTEQEESCRE